MEFLKVVFVLRFIPSSKIIHSQRFAQGNHIKQSGEVADNDNSMTPATMTPATPYIWRVREKKRKNRHRDALISASYTIIIHDARIIEENFHQLNRTSVIGFFYIKSSNLWMKGLEIGEKKKGFVKIWMQLCSEWRCKLDVRFRRRIQALGSVYVIELRTYIIKRTKGQTWTSFW